MTMWELYDIAYRFRKAMEAAISEGHAVRIRPLHGFPVGSCAYSSDLLQRYMFEQGISTYSVSGNAKNAGYNESHAWLETAEGIVIDITIDQYEYAEFMKDYDGPVYVGVRDDFHDMFDTYDSLPYQEQMQTLVKTREQMLFDEFYSAVVSYLR